MPRLAVPALACLVGWGCAAEDGASRPAALESACVECGAPGVVSRSAEAGADEAGADAGNGSRVGEVAFELRLLQDERFSLDQSSPLEGGAVLRVESARDLTLTVETDDDEVTVAESLLAPDTWVAVLVRDQALAMNTLQRVDTRPGRAKLAVVSPQVLDEVLAGLLLSPPVSIDPLAAQAVLRVTSEATGEPVQGVTVEAPGGLVFYESGGVFGADLTSTGADGLVLLVNLPATPNEVGSVSLSLGGGIDRQIWLDALGGAATLSEIVAD